MPPRTKSYIKLVVAEKVRRQGNEFTTQNIIEAIRKEKTNTLTCANRIGKFIQASDLASFDRGAKKWRGKTRKIIPNITESTNENSESNTKQRVSPHMVNNQNEQDK